MRLVAAILLLTTACARKGDGTAAAGSRPSVEAALENLCGTLDTAGAPVLIAEGMLPLRAGRDAILSRPEADLAIDEAAAARRIRGAQVVLVADLHRLDPIRRAFGRLVVEYTAEEDLRSGRVALAFEALPYPLEKAAEDARRSGRRSVQDVMCAAWPWPVLAYVDLLCDPRFAACPTLAVGTLGLRDSPARTVPDRDRQPVPMAALDVNEAKYGFSHTLRNDACAARIHEWLRGDPKHRALALYGAAHLMGEQGIRTRLERLGLTVVVVVPFLPEWELALRRRFGPSAASRWYQVMPGVYRGPLVPDDEIVEEAREARIR